MAAPTFRAAEVVDMAMVVENQGIAFYDGCLQGSLPAEVKRVFGFLLDQERAHAAIFAAMRQPLEAYRLPESYAGEAESFRESFLAGRVFPPGPQAAEVAGKCADAHAAIDFGIELEKRSIALYRRMLQLVPPSERTIVESVLAEEQAHRERLEHLRGEIGRR